METTHTAGKRDALRIAIQVGMFLVAYFFLDLFFCYPLFKWIGGGFAGPTTAGLVSAAFASWLCLRVFEDFPVAALGLWWNRASADNLAAGLAGGIGSACLVLVPPLLLGVAHIEFTGPFDWSGMAFATVFLAVGAIGEELLCRGYAFQILMSRLGPIRHGASHGRAFRPAARRESPRHLVRHRQYGGLRNAVRLRLRAQPRPVAAHRTAFRLELRLAAVRRQPERD